LKLNTTDLKSVVFHLDWRRCRLKLNNPRLEVGGIPVEVSCCSNLKLTQLGSAYSFSWVKATLDLRRIQRIALH
jgi:hypothetical protein